MSKCNDDTDTDLVSYDASITINVDDVDDVDDVDEDVDDVDDGC